MALKLNHEIKQTGMKVEHAYARISEIRYLPGYRVSIGLSFYASEEARVGGKEAIEIIEIHVFKGDDGKANKDKPFNSYFDFEALDDSKKNLVKIAYEFLKNLDEFKEAVDC